MFLSWSIIVNRLPENRLEPFTQCLIRSLYFFFFYLSFFLSVSRHTAIRWWASMIISDEIEVATNVNQRWNENLRNYSNYRIAIPIKFGNREWCDDDKGICHKVWNVQNFCWVCFLKLFPFYFLISFVVVVVVRANPNLKTHDLMENARRKMMICNLMCNLLHDSSANDALKMLQAKLEGLIAELNKPAITQTPGKLLQLWTTF